MISTWIPITDDQEAQCVFVCVFLSIVCSRVTCVALCRTVRRDKGNSCGWWHCLQISDAGCIIKQSTVSSVESGLSADYKTARYCKFSEMQRKNKTSFILSAIC